MLEQWMLCVTLNLLDPTTPVVCEGQPSHEACQGEAEHWLIGAQDWEQRSQLSVSIAAACWPLRNTHVHL